MKIQPGPGYNFMSSSSGFTLDTSNPFPDTNVSSKLYQQFQCKVESESVGETTKFFLKMRKGVVNYTWSNFPYYPAPLDPPEYEPYQIFEKQARITDWAVYQNGKRTAGTATDGEAFEWMADNGKIELPAGASGAYVLVLMSLIDWYDRDGLHEDRRLIDAHMPFVSVVSSADTTAMTTLTTNQGNSSIHGGMLYWKESAPPEQVLQIAFDPPYPYRIGYTFKKIARLDWNDTTNQWDLTQYEYGPMNVRVLAVTDPVYTYNAYLPDDLTYNDYLAAGFSNCLNYAWFEGTWAIPSYTLNPSNWWYHLVDL
jgi:hypothetical protein